MRRREHAGRPAVALGLLLIWLLCPVPAARAEERTPSNEGQSIPSEVTIVGILLHGARGEPPRSTYAAGERLHAIVELETSADQRQELQLELRLKRGDAVLERLSRRGPAREVAAGIMSLGAGLQLPSNLPSESLGACEAELRVFAGESVLASQTFPLQLGRRLEVSEVRAERERTAPGGLHTLRLGFDLIGPAGQERELSIGWTLRSATQTTGGSWQHRASPGQRSVELDLLVPADFSPGTHELTIELRDQASGEAVREAATLTVDPAGERTGAYSVDLERLPSYCGTEPERSARHDRALRDGVGVVELHGVDQDTLDRLLAQQARLIRQGGRPWQWVIYPRSTQARELRFLRALDGTLLLVMRKSLPVPPRELAATLEATERILSGYVPQRSSRIPFTRQQETRQP